MQPLEHHAYLTLREGAEVLEADRFGDKVLRLANGNFLKLFRRKRLITSAAIYPYAQRFADNLAALQLRNIPCPRIEQVYRIASISRDAVIYQPLPGETLRDVLASATKVADDLDARLGQFIARLHLSGVYFRSLHLGNILLTPTSELGLIDVADMRCQSRPLSTWKRRRNLQHLLRYQKDMTLIEQRLGWEMVMQHYRAACL
jgi:tRNA A-37 threonylcarbamoyl transferase component Bud32